MNRWRRDAGLIAATAAAVWVGRGAAQPERGAPLYEGSVVHINCRGGGIQNAVLAAVVVDGVPYEDVLWGTAPLASPAPGDTVGSSTFFDCHLDPLVEEDAVP